MGRLAVAVTLAVALTSSFTVAGCRRKDTPPAADSRAPQAAPAPAAAASNSPANQPATPAAGSPALKPPRGAQALSAAFEAGALPEPATLRPGGPDRQAEALASAVFKRDENSTAAIYAAVLAAGFGVRKRDGTIVRTVTPGQGIVLDEFDVIGMARLYGLGYGVTLKHLADSFRQAPPWKELKLEELLQAGLREAAYSPRPEVKFWALFINELAHRSAAPYDLLGDPDPGVNRLDPIQLQFILARLAADYDSRYRRTASTLRPDVVRASWSGQGGGGGGCSSSTVEDYAAVASTSMFGGAVESMGGSAASYGQAVQRANFVLVLMKFIATYASLEHDMQIEGGRLTRTKDLTAGNQTTIRDRVNIKETWAQYVNCARQGLNVAGLDMSFPDAGPVKDVKVWWNIEEGRDTLVFFPFAAAGPSGGGFSSTDEDGVAKALITGFPQKQDLSRRRIVAMPKSASVRASAQIKSAKFKDAESVLGTAGDYGSLILAFFTGDFAGAIVGLVTENFYRAAWGYSEPYEFEVLDWEPCENVWAGSINYSETYIEVGYAARPGMNMSRWSEVQKYSASTTITQSRPDGPAGRSTAQAELTKKRFSTGLTQCYMVNNIETTVKGSAERDAYLSVGIQPDGTYRVGYTLPLVDATGTYKASTKKEGQCNNPFNMGKDDTQAQTLKISPGTSLQIEGRVDPASPDVLSGSASETREVRDGVRTARVTWALQRCPSR